MSKHKPETFRKLLQNIYQRRAVLEPKELEDILENVQQILDNENPIIRPRDSYGRPGGLILLPHDRITIIVPDLHARGDYLLALMDFVVSHHSVIDLFLSGKVQIVCVGDGFHGETHSAAIRWQKAWMEYQNSYRKHEMMDEEMRDSLSLMAMVMLLKTASPDGFHFLKGNHENVANSNDRGNRAFYKYAQEGEMVRDWFIRFLGVEMLQRWVVFESSLPILAVGEHFMISHAEPRCPYAPEEVIGYRGRDSLIFDFTWTGNGESEEGCVDTMLRMYLGESAQDAFYFGGHRPISGLYALRANGRYVQIHNPADWVAVVLHSGMVPIPSRDVFRIGKE